MSQYWYEIENSATMEYYSIVKNSNKKPTQKQKNSH